MNSQQQPIFVICHARSGSTLMRYVLDTHEELVCPPELHLGYVMAQLLRMYRILHGSKTLDKDCSLEEKIAGEVRKVINGIMGSVCSEARKDIWCEKSVSTISHLTTIRKIYPYARYICMYRHCMDFINSALERLWLGFAFGYEEYVRSRDPKNVVDSLAAFWCEKTQAILNFEKEDAKQCFAVKYESLVEDPDTTCRKIFGFLELPYDDGFVGKIFEVKHDVGAGDPKIVRTKRIEKGSVGLGRQVPVHQILPTTLNQMNFLLEALDYETVGADWNATALSMEGEGVFDTTIRLRNVREHS